MIPSQRSVSGVKPRIVVIENDENLRKGFSIILASNSDYNVINAYATADEAIKNFRKDFPDIVFTEIQLKGEEGVSIIKKLKKLDPGVHVVAITHHEEISLIFEAFAAGTSGYLLKGSNPTELLDAVTEILNNGAPMSPRVAKLVVSSFQRNLNSPLSRRETEILSSLAMGKTYKITADSLHIGMETVKSHVKNIYSKLDVTSKSEAIELARTRSLI